MLRKTTAISFLAVMTLLIALKHPVLGYCLCLDTYFAGNCVCEVEKPTPATQDPDLPHSGCCSSCEVEQSQENNSSKPSPCDDCTEHLSIDVGDFVWQSSDNIPSDTETLYTPPAFELNQLQLPLASARATLTARGDPPPETSPSDMPLYLRLAVLRL